MITILRIQEILAANPKELIPAHKLAARSGITAAYFYKRSNKWLKNGHISREKVEGREFCYYLTDHQLQAHKLKKALQCISVTALSPVENVTNICRSIRRICA